MGAGPVAAGAATCAQREPCLDFVLDFRSGGADEEEDAEESEGGGPWVQGVDRGGEGCDEEAEGGEGGVGPGAADDGEDGGDRDVGLHGGGGGGE